MIILLIALQIAGGVILAASYVPQIIQIHRTKSVADLNTKTFLGILLGLLLTLPYGIYLTTKGWLYAWFLVINTASALVLCFLVGQLLYYGKRLEFRCVYCHGTSSDCGCCNGTGKVGIKQRIVDSVLRETYYSIKVAWRRTFGR